MMLAVFTVAEVFARHIGKGEVDMKSITVKAGERPGHKGRMQIVLRSDFLGDKFEQDATIGKGIARFQIDFMLRQGDFVVSLFVLDPTLF